MSSRSRGFSSQDLRHAVIGGGTNFLAILAGLAMPIYHGVVAQLYGPAIYGLYNLGLGITEVVARLAILGTDTGLMRYIPSHRVAGESELERRSLFTAFWLSLLGSSVLAGLAALIALPLAAWQHKPESAIAIRLLAPSAPFTVMVMVLIAATQAAKVMRYNLFVRGLAQPLLLMTLAVPVGVVLHSLTGLCLAHLLATAITALLAYWAAARVYREIPLRRALKSGPPYWALVRFSLPMGLSEFLNAVLQRADLILLSMWVDEVQLGIYAGAEFIARAVSNARYIFDPVVTPIIAEAVKQNDFERLRANLSLLTRWVMILTFPIVGFVVGFRSELLSLYGKAFVGAGAAFIVLNLGHLINSALGLVGWVISMSGRSGLVLVNNLVAACANILLCLLLIPRYGLLGAATASAAAVALIQLLQLGEVIFIVRVQPLGSNVLKVVVAGALSLTTLHLLQPLVADLATALRMAIGTAVMLFVHGALLWVLGLDDAEHNLLKRLRGG